MKISAVQRIREEDLAAGGEVHPSVKQLLGPLNEFIEQVAQAVAGRLTFVDNLDAKIVEMKLTSGVAQEISIPQGRRVFGVFPVECFGKRITAYGFTRRTDGNIDLVVEHTGASKTNCRVIILMEG